jgi:hypothetical protein
VLLQRLEESLTPLFSRIGPLRRALLLLAPLPRRWKPGEGVLVPLRDAPPFTSVSLEMRPCSFRNCTCIARCNWDRWASVRFTLLLEDMFLELVLGVLEAESFFFSSSQLEAELEEDLEPEEASSSPPPSSSSSLERVESVELSSPLEDRCPR